MHKKQLYAAPETEVLELRLEGTVLAGSPVDYSNSPSPKFGTGQGWDDQGWAE